MSLVRISNDCIKNFLSRENAEYALDTLEIPAAWIENSQDLKVYFLNIIKYLEQRGLLQRWLQVLSEEPLGYIFSEKYMTAKQGQKKRCPYPWTISFSRRRCWFLFWT